MRWATFQCDKCGWTTTQPASASVAHPCPVTGHERTIPRLDESQTRH